MLLQLHARRSSRDYPPGSGSTGWKLQLTKRVRGGSVPQPTTHVSSRSEAVQALVSAMRRVNRVLCSERDGHALASELTEPFGDGVNDGRPR